MEETCFDFEDFPFFSVHFSENYRLWKRDNKKVEKHWLERALKKKFLKLISSIIFVIEVGWISTFVMAFAHERSELRQFFGHELISKDVKYNFRHFSLASLGYFPISTRTRVAMKTSKWNQPFDSKLFLLGNSLGIKTCPSFRSALKSQTLAAGGASSPLIGSSSGAGLLQANKQAPTHELPLQVSSLQFPSDYGLPLYNTVSLPRNSNYSSLQPSFFPKVGGNMMPDEQYPTLPFRSPYIHTADSGPSAIGNFSE